MSLTSSFSVADVDYLGDVLTALKYAHAAIFGAESAYAEGRTTCSTIGLYRRLEEMKHSSTFLASHHGGDPHHQIFGDGLQYRKPVWNVFTAILTNANNHDYKEQKDCAEWFQGILSQAIKYARIEEALCELRRRLSRDGFTVGESLQSTVQISINAESSGKSAKLVLAIVLPQLIQEIEKMIGETPTP